MNLLLNNPSLLELDISNKLSPKVDLSIVETLAHSCRCLTVLKLSDYRANDPKTLLVLCGKKVMERQQQMTTSLWNICKRCLQLKSTIAVSTDETIQNQPLVDVVSIVKDDVANVTVTDQLLPVHNALKVCQCESKLFTKEEHENSIVSGTLSLNCNDSELNEDNSDEDLYESDGSLTVLMIEDCDGEYGCLELEVLSLDNVNINDQVMAVLLQYLPRLRDLNLCDTDICNPWRLLNPSCCPHLLQLEELDIKSTALSRTALELIPKFHPDLHRFSISSTMMPPHTYANIGKLTGVADLELIGGQFYPSKPEEIFNEGIAPAIQGIGQHLRLLNLAYFAHIKFEVIPKSCPKLERLDMSCTFVTFQYPCDSLGDCCHNLRSLNLASCRIEAYKEAIDNPQSVPPSEALQCMIGQPLKLTELNISGLAVSDETLKSIFPCAVHPLQVLNLSHCTLATVNAIEYIWSKCPYLHTIDLTYCRDMTVDDFTLLEKKFYIDRPLFKSEGKLNWK